MTLTFEQLRTVNGQRVERWHPGFPHDDWTGADWSNAVCGEAGEMANVVKKLRRRELGMADAVGIPVAELRRSLAIEIGDTLVYLDLLAQFYGLRLEDCTVMTFNRVSEREGFPERLPVEGTGATAADDGKVAS